MRAHRARRSRRRRGVCGGARRVVRRGGHREPSAMLRHWARGCLPAVPAVRPAGPVRGRSGAPSRCAWRASGGPPRVDVAAYFRGGGGGVAGDAPVARCRARSAARIGATPASVASPSRSASVIHRKRCPAVPRGAPFHARTTKTCNRTVRSSSPVSPSTTVSFDHRVARERLLGRFAGVDLAARVFPASGRGPGLCTLLDEAPARGVLEHADTTSIGARGAAARAWSGVVMAFALPRWRRAWPWLCAPVPIVAAGFVCGAPRVRSLVCLTRRRVPARRDAASSRGALPG